MPNTITIIGNLGKEVDLRFTPAGAAVASFSIADTPRTLDKTTNTWKEGETLWTRCTLWKDAAENLAESSLRPGTRVIVTGRLVQKSYAKDGETKTYTELQVDEIGPSLKFATAVVNKRSKDTATGDPWGGNNADAPF